MHLVAGLENRGHVLYTDNFYTSASQALSLQGIQMSLVGTIRANRRSFPVAMKADLKQFERYAERGTCRYIRDGNVLYLPWKDKRTVSMLPTIHQGHEHNLVQRNAKIAGQYQQLELQQPKCIANYNRSMGGVDVFDQVVATHHVLRKTKKYWKSLFLHFLDVSAVNAYFLFEIWRKKHPDSIKLRKNFRHADFRVNLIRQLAGIEESTPPPQGQFRHRRSSPSDPILSHRCTCQQQHRERRTAKIAERWMASNANV